MSVKVEINYNGHEDGDWCDVLVSMPNVPGRPVKCLYAGHGDISPGQLAEILKSVAEECDYDWIEVVYNDKYTFD